MKCPNPLEPDEQNDPLPNELDRAFREGFLAGATAYCAAVGHSGLKSENSKLREVFDAQRLRTIELFEKLQSEKPEAAQPTPPDRGHDA